MVALSLPRDPVAGTLAESLTLPLQANRRGLSSLKGSWPAERFGALGFY